MKSESGMPPPAFAQRDLFQEVTSILLGLISSLDLQASERVIQYLKTVGANQIQKLILDSVVGDFVTIWDRTQFGFSSLEYDLLILYALSTLFKIYVLPVIIASC